MFHPLSMLRGNVCLLQMVCQTHSPVWNTQNRRMFSKKYGVLIRRHEVYMERKILNKAH